MAFVDIKKRKKKKKRKKRKKKYRPVYRGAPVTKVSDIKTLILIYILLVFRCISVLNVRC